MPSTEASASLPVSWAGNDGSGPGIADYSVHVSDNGGAYKPFVMDTTNTSASFTGQAGHSYAFYSVATDPLGLTQPVPTAAQSATKVVLASPPPPLVTLNKVQAVTNKKHQVTEVLLTFSGAINSRQADSTSAYRLATPGKGGSYTVKTAGTITLKSAVYTGATDTVALTPTKPFPLSKPVELVVYGTGSAGLTDSRGRLIDGDHNGTAGGNAVAILTSGGAKTSAVPQTEIKPASARAAAVDAILAQSSQTSRVRSRKDRR